MLYYWFMELGDEITLYHPKAEGLKAVAVQKILGQPYYEKGNQWEPSRNLYLMTDEELSVFGKEKNEEIAGLMKKFSSQEILPMSERTAVAREAAVSFGGVKIMALKGQETILSEYLGEEVNHQVWEFEPHPYFENLVANRDTNQGVSLVGTVERASKADEDSLWHFLEMSVEDIKREEGVSLDIKNLTPHQAVFLIETLIKKRMNLEYLIVHGDTIEVAKRVIADNEQTSRVDLLELADKDPKKMKKEVHKLKSKIDHMSADELLVYRFGVCRHIAATSQKLYEVLKKRQDGLLMNGSYLVYHGENVGRQKEKGLIETHAYNVLVATSPEGNGEEEMSLSVLDPTWMLDPQHADYTYERISQAVSFLAEYGSDLGVKKKSEVCEHLAIQAADRLEKYMISNRTIALMDDYASLLVQSGEDVKKNVVEKLKNVFSATNLDKVEFLNLLFEIPVLSYPDEDDNRILREEYESKIIEEISHQKFYNLLYRDELVLLRQRIEENVSGFNQIWLNIMKINAPGTRGRILRENNQGSFRCVNEYIRASVQLHEVPSEKMMKIVNDVIEIDTKTKCGLINKDLVEELRAMTLANGT